MLWGHLVKLQPMFPDTCYMSMRVCSDSMAMFTRMTLQIILSDYYVTLLGKHVYMCGERTGACEDEKDKDRRTLLNSMRDSLWNGVSEVWPGKVKCLSRAAGNG